MGGRDGAGGYEWAGSSAVGVGEEGREVKAVEERESWSHGGVGISIVWRWWVGWLIGWERGCVGEI